MPAPLIKLLPNTILIIVFGYLAWSYWDATSPPPPPGDALPEISANVLRPQPPDPTLRDPFGQSVRFQLGEFKKPDSRRGGAAAIAKKPDTAGESPAPRATTGGTPAPSAAPHSPTVAVISSATGVATVATVAAASPPPDPDLKLPADFVLNATMLHDGHNFAVINDHGYRTGEKLPETGAKTWTVKEIRRHGVLLALGEQALELKYPDEHEGHGSGVRPAARGAVPPGRGSPPRGGSKAPINMKDIVIPGATHR